MGGRLRLRRPSRPRLGGTRQTEGVSPDGWAVVVNDGRGSMWERYDGSMGAFLAALLSRRYRSEIVTDRRLFITVTML